MMGGFGIGPELQLEDNAFTMSLKKHDKVFCTCDEVGDIYNDFILTPHGHPPKATLLCVGEVGAIRFKPRSPLLSERVFIVGYACIDARKDSPTYGKDIGFYPGRFKRPSELTPSERQQIPHGE